MPAVEMRGIVKRFGSLIANDNVDFNVEEGEIRALVGENGAGKTTLMRILFGLLRPEEGTITLRGQEVDFHSPRDAIAHGVGMVHQHFMLFNDLSVAENVVYGMEPRRMGMFVDQERAKQEVSELADRYGFQINPAARLGSLSVGVRQRVEILKILYRGANVLIFDEPTAVLTPQERDDLFEVINTLADQGKTIILITHKLKEVMAVSHSATVLRRGRLTGNVKTADSSPQEIASLMVGREVLMHIERPPAQPGEAVLSVEKLHLAGTGPHPVLNEVSFEVRSGEIVGLAGIAGNGQTELVDVLTGLSAAGRGQINLNSQEISSLSVEARRDSGMAYVPEDRYARGLATGSTVAENLAMGFHRDPPIASRGIMNLGEVRNWAEKLGDEFDIRMTDPREEANNLSGGNLQKIVVAREFSQNTHFILVDQPTRGVDISATEFIHRKLIDRRNAGDAILVISADLDEIMSLSDRILVITEGSIVADRQADSVDEHELGLYMAGGTAHETAEQPQKGAVTND